MVTTEFEAIPTPNQREALGELRDSAYETAVTMALRPLVYAGEAYTRKRAAVT